MVQINKLYYSGENGQNPQFDNKSTHRNLKTGGKLNQPHLVQNIKLLEKVNSVQGYICIFINSQYKHISCLIINAFADPWRVIGEGIKHYPALMLV